MMRRASLGHGSDCLCATGRSRSITIDRDRRRPFASAQACAAGAHRAALGRAPIGAGGRPRSERQPPGRVALAAALRRRGCGRPASRQDASARHAAARCAHGRRRVGADLFRTAGGGNPLDGTSCRQGGRDLVAIGSADLERPPSPAAPRADLQALARPRLRREGRGHRRPLHGPSGPRRCAVH